MSTADRLFVALGALYGGAAVVLGALAAHALRERLGEVGLELVELATRYELVHGAALVALGLGGGRLGRGGTWAGALLAAGTALFCFGLTGLAFTGWRTFAYVTPFGGTALIAGWFVLAAAALRAR